MLNNTFNFRVNLACLHHNLLLDKVISVRFKKKLLQVCFIFKLFVRISSLCFSTQFNEIIILGHVQVNVSRATVVVSRATVVVSRAILVFSRATVVVSRATLVFSRVMKLLYLVSYVQVNVSRATLVISRATLVFSRVMTWKVQPEGDWVLVARIKLSVLIFYSACAYRDPAAKGPVSIYHLGWAERICNSPHMNFVHPPWDAFTFL